MKLFDLRGLKIWIIGLVLVLNLVLTGFFFVGANAILSQQGGWANGMDIALMLGMFLLSALIGFGVAYLSRSERGMSYAVWGAIGSFAMASVLLYEAGLLAFLVATMALMGGYNGGLVGQRLSLNRKK
jgi:multidrug transporter EmrE-like cation transporter